MRLSLNLINKQNYISLWSHLNPFIHCHNCHNLNCFGHFDYFYKSPKDCWFRRIEIMRLGANHPFYTRKNAQVVTALQTIATNLSNCQQVMFALLVSMLLQQVSNKLLTTCNKLDVSDLLQGCSNKSAWYELDTTLLTLYPWPHNVVTILLYTVSCYTLYGWNNLIKTVIEWRVNLLMQIWRHVQSQRAIGQHRNLFLRIALSLYKSLVYDYLYLVESY